MTLNKAILSDPVSRWIFNNSPYTCYLVGGYVRDLIIRRPYKDRDFIGRKVKELSLKTARKFKGKVIYIQRYNMYRVVTDENKFIDFTEMGKNIVSDLYGRDFTINAIAWSLNKGIVDPLNGIDDIRRNIIRIIHDKSLSDDPLRCLRAFRFASQFHFSIENKTLSTIKKYSKHVKSVASERITDELIKLLNMHDTTELIYSMLKHNVLHELIPLSKLNLNENIKLIDQLDKFISYINSDYAKISNSYNLTKLLESNIRQNLSRYGLIKLALLTYTDDNKTDILSALTLSTVINRRLRFIHSAVRMSRGRLTRNKLYRILRCSRECMEEVSFVISIMKKKNDITYLASADKLKSIIRDRNGINGHEILKIGNLKPGRKIGMIKDETYRQMFLGNLTTNVEVMNFIKDNLT